MGSCLAKKLLIRCSQGDRQLLWIPHPMGLPTLLNGDILRDLDRGAGMDLDFIYD